MSMAGKRRNLLIGVALGLAILTVYWPVVLQDFVNYDDQEYVTDNPRVQKGIAWEGMVWAFTTRHSWNWHPLTWLSHMLDCQLFGLDAGAHKVVNVAFHIANTLILFFALVRMTAAPWRSAFVAAGFALHPLHVESVAWVSERKDVLSAFFWMLTMLAYVRYAEQPSTRRYSLVLASFALGLMAKPMLVTLPCVLLLLDLWPLGRTAYSRPAVGERAPSKIPRLIWEKVPFLLLSAALSVVTYWAQATGGTFGSAVKPLPLAVRACNAVVSYVRYINKFLLPVNLAVFYPQPGAWRLPEFGLTAMVIVLLTVLLLRALRANPYLTVGWFWYLGTLVPAIGLIQVGDQSIADRYTYIPSIGLLVLMAWGVPELVSGWRGAEVAVRAVAIGVIIAWMATTRHQLQYWANSISLFEHAIAVTSDNYIAQNNLGAALRATGKLEQAAPHFQEAIRIWPQYPEANKNLGDILARTGRFDEAVHHYQQALQKRPDWAEAHNNLGTALAMQGSTEEAIAQFSDALRLQPDFADAAYNLEAAREMQKSPKKSSRVKVEVR
jgi:protein O-mannosyl-transferase